jgi:hypothetical protein
VVGEVLGKYHPHGDSATYEALVRMAQDFSMRYTLIDGQGNFGSVDGDSAAAYRYTECRLGRITSEMLADIDMETVDFMPNYDGKEHEPVTLPTKVPNLLINGSSGMSRAKQSSPRSRCNSPPSSRTSRSASFASAASNCLALFNWLSMITLPGCAVICLNLSADYRPGQGLDKEKGEDRSSPDRLCLEDADIKTGYRRRD